MELGVLVLAGVLSEFLARIDYTPICIFRYRLSIAHLHDVHTICSEKNAILFGQHTLSRVTISGMIWSIKCLQGLI